MKATNEVISTGNPVAVTFDTLTAAKELRETGLNDRQSEAIVATISKAMSETVATKADLELQGTVTRADIEALRAATKADIEALRNDTKADIGLLRADMVFQFAEVRAETKADIQALRNDTKADIGLLRTDMELQFAEVRAETKADIQAVRTDLKLLEQSMTTIQDRSVIRLGALMVTITFLLLAIGPFYFRWVMSLMASQ